MNELLVLFYILLLSVLGASFLDLFKVFEEKKLLAYLSLGFAVGVGIIIVQMFLFSLMGVNWNRFLLFGPWIIWLIFYAIRKKKDLFLLHMRFPGGKTEILLLLFIVFLFIFVVLQSQLRPVVGWDAIATWLMMGKGFYLDGGIRPELYRYLQIDNPPGIGFLLASFYVFSNKINDQAVLLVYSTFYGMLLLVFFAFLRERMPGKYAMLFTFLLASTQALLRQAGRFEAGYADLPLAFLFFTSGILLQKAVLQKKRPLFIAGAFIASIGTLFKNEGLPFFVLYIIIIFLFSTKKDIISKIKYLLFPFILFLLWQLYKTTQNTYYTYYLHSKVVLGRVPVIFFEAAKEFLNITRWNLLWISFIISVLSERKRVFKDPLALLIILQFFAYLSIFVFTPLDFVDHMHSSFDRLLLQISPLAMFMIAEVSYTILKRFRTLYVKKIPVSRSQDTRSTRRSK
jgi:hypothetical protein